jgi:hypothetical protein
MNIKIWDDDKIIYILFFLKIVILKSFTLHLFNLHFIVSIIEIVFKNRIFHYPRPIKVVLHCHSSKMWYIWLKVTWRLWIHIYICLMFLLLLNVIFNCIEVISEFNQVLLKYTILHITNLTQRYKPINNLSSPKVKSFFYLIGYIILTLNYL